jgi:hypothetical protein
MKRSELKQIIKEEIKKTLKESYIKFADIQPGEQFLRFGKDGQLWEKISETEAKFIKNVGKKLFAKGTDAYKQPRIFSWPKTMEVTRINE